MEGYDNNRFRDNLAYLLARQDRTGREVAEAVGTTPTSISRYLNGARKPDVENVIKIARFFNVTTDWLLGVSSENNEEVTK